ncbi:MAG: cobaltochelatase subunit CobN [Alphaproteobacteria bacterium]|nr:cobaltochelatase subunit CobN [Alphaproteobacteria bacterium]
MTMRSFASAALAALALMLGVLPAESRAQDARTPSVVVLAVDPASPAKGKLLERIAAERGVALEWVFVDGMPPEAIAARLKGRDVVLLDWVFEQMFGRLVGIAQPALRSFEGKVWGGLMWRRPDLTRGLTPAQAARLFEYWDNGGIENYRRLADFLRTDILGRPGQAGGEPIVMPEQALYHPDAPQRVYTDLASFLAWRAPKPGQPVVGIGFHRVELKDDTTLHVDDLIRRVEAKGGYALPFWDPNAGRKTLPLLTRDGKVLSDVMVVFTGLYTSVDEQKQWMQAIDQPVLQALPYHGGTVEDWRQDDQGLPISRQGVFYTLNETAGRIDMTMVSARRPGDEKLAPIPEQMDALAERALKQAALRRKPNAEKRVAIVVWNTPSGEENFAASYLNVPASIVEIAAALRAEGYDVPALDEATVIETIKKLIRPYYRTKDDAELRKLVAAGLAERLPVAAYKAHLATLPAETRAAIDAVWEAPEETYLTLKDGARADFVVPRWQHGNLVILPQPLRGARRSEEDDITHDKKRPLHHAYRAVYLGVVQQGAVDAVIHLGTHGTQEWAPGKERGPSVFDDTQTTIGNVPVIYPYTVANVGEAIIAKRRGRAVTISHNSPPFAPSGLYGELNELHEALHQAESGDEGAVREALRRQVVALATKVNLTKDIGMADAEIAADYPRFADRLHKHLHTVGGMPQPLGMHTFGKVAESDKTLLTILQILGPDYLKVWTPEPEEVFAEPFEKLQGEPLFVALRRAVVEAADLAQFPEAARPFLEEARRHYANFTSPLELQSLKAALSGRYVPTSTGNDPLRNPDSVPTGRNLYGFDPRKIPTKASWEAGTKLARDLTDSYKAKHGAWPDKITFSLWSTETLNHFGVVEAQILSLLGTRPVWNQRGDVVGVEVVPRAELDRPRVDTVLSLTGLYRDNLPELLALLQGAVNKVAALEESDNPLVANISRTAAALVAKGIEKGRAERLARVRMFGNESGVYGTNLPEATVASGAWDSESTLAETYLSRMSWLFGTEPDTRNVKVEDVNLYAEALRGTKAAVLSRSTNNHGIVSIDHPFEYLGGIGLAVRHLEGRTPDLVISDLRNTRDFKNQSVAEFMSIELRSRYFHPRYVKEMMNERYSGATKMVDVVNNFWGWNVMDRSSVRADQWQEFYEVYVQDKLNLGIKDWFLEHHPAALAQISERMLEAVRKGYWDAPEDVVRALVETHQEIARSRDLLVENRKFAEFVEAKALGFGLLPAAPPAEPVADAAATAGEQVVTGIRLEREAVAADAPDPLPLMGVYALVVGSLGFGMAWEIGQAMWRRRAFVA